MPWDAEERFAEHSFNGVILYAGQHNEDISDYSESGIKQPKCHGYVCALTDVWDDELGYVYNWLAPGAEQTSTLTRTSNKDWTAYGNFINMRTYADSDEDGVIDSSVFPAASACQTYGHSARELEAPSNNDRMDIAYHQNADYPC